MANNMFQGDTTSSLLGNAPSERGSSTPNSKPCDRCRTQHLKCVYLSDKCQRCERAGSECVRSRRNIRFRGVSANKFQQNRRNSERRARKSPPRTLQFVNETQNVLANHSAGHTTLESDVATVDDNDTIMSSEDSGDQLTKNHAENRSDLQATSNLRDHEFSIQVEDVPTETQTVKLGVSDQDRTARIESSSLRRTIIASPSDGDTSIDIVQSLTPLSRVFSSDRASVNSSYTFPYKWTSRAQSSRYLDELVKPLPSRKSYSSQTYLETILLRYFIEELAPWFDLCDPDCHFANVVPQLARTQGPLRNALLTISARNLARNRRFRNSAGTVMWNDRLLPELTEEFAVPYHTECIRDLLRLSMNSRNLHDERLLAAVIALRTDEEMGHNVLEDEDDQQVFLRVANVFIEAQVPSFFALPHSSPIVFMPALDKDTGGLQGALFQTSPIANSSMASPLDQTESELGASGLRQACFWTAFRQELHGSFLKQQPVRFPLARFDSFRHLTPAIDAVWANRMVTFCADVLEFCYGSESNDGKVSPAYADQQRWRELRAHERDMSSLLPDTFVPIYCSEPNVALNNIFPEIWYLNPCHASGTTYMELARMLLEIFNPTRPQLGHGFITATNAFISSTKKILFRLCGIALSNRHCPPTLINACIGISIFGEYFSEPGEQDALLEILSLMTNFHAYPTRQIATSLRRAWDREEPTLAASNLSSTGNHMDT